MGAKVTVGSHFTMSFQVPTENALADKNVIFIDQLQALMQESAQGSFLPF